MKRTEEVELAVLCLVHDDERILVQERVKDDWKGLVLPGGHIEVGESVVDAVVREIKEETGLTISGPKLCGIKQFPLREGDYSLGRYLVFLFEARDFEGDLVSSEEGEMYWINKKDLDKYDLVEDFHDLIEVMTDEGLSEFQYLVEDGIWKIIKK